MKQFITSDYHLGHANIINYCNRPFKSLDHMNETIIRNHNQRVKPNDIVYHVGDFCFRNSSDVKGEGVRIAYLEWEQQLNGKIIYIMGNHDRNNGIKTGIYSITIKTHNHKFNLVHNPLHYNPNYFINLVGHRHEKLDIEYNEVTGYLVNVGVDVNNFMPINFNEVLKMEKELLR